MVATLQEAKSALEAQGLHVSLNNASSLLIGGAVVHADDELRLFKDACVLNRRAGLWVAVFPAEGLLVYEVAGALQELVSLVVAVYNHHRHAGGDFKDAFKGLVKEADKYLIGRSLSAV